jgi:hypothetical protein
VRCCYLTGNQNTGMLGGRTPYKQQPTIMVDEAGEANGVQHCVTGDVCAMPYLVRG